jgi:lipopolysaccharide/colanic/teichoic acid biosynthesis glycosyltransferase
MRWTNRRLTLLFVDLGLIAIATVLALALRDNLEISSAKLESLLPYLAATLAAATIVLPAAGLTQSMWRFSAMADYLRVVAAVVAIVLGAVAFGFLANGLAGVTRALPVVQALLMAFLLVGVRVAARLRYKVRDQHRSRALVTPPLDTDVEETVLVVGVNAVTDLFLRATADFAPTRIRVAGVLGRTARHSGRTFKSHRILGVPEEVEKILRELELHGVSVNRIVVTMAYGDLSPAAQQALHDIETSSDIRVDLFAERIGLAESDSPSSRPSSQHESEDDPLAFRSSALETMMQRPYWHMKRVFDLAAAAAFLVLLAPLFLVIGLVVAMDVGLPTVFWQQRPGVRGRPFKLYKFRTMRGAHDQHGRLIPDDQRVSFVGRFLRQSRLDELPQLFNILLGEMSFVGPRPLLPQDQACAERLLVKPGLTGWAQVNGGRQIAARDKAVLDVWYMGNASLWLDLKILAQTLPVLVLGERHQAKALQQAWRELEAGPAAVLVRSGAGRNSLGSRTHPA